MAAPSENPGAMPKPSNRRKTARERKSHDKPVATAPAVNQVNVMSSGILRPILSLSPPKARPPIQRTPYVASSSKDAVSSDTPNARAISPRTNVIARKSSASFTHTPHAATSTRHCDAVMSRYHGRVESEDLTTSECMLSTLFPIRRAAKCNRYHSDVQHEAFALRESP